MATEHGLSGPCKALTPCAAFVKGSTDASWAHSVGVLKLEDNLPSDREPTTEARLS